MYLKCKLLMFTKQWENKTVLSFSEMLIFGVRRQLM
jgi:hypothetical protein